MICVIHRQKKTYSLVGDTWSWNCSDCLKEENNRDNFVQVKKDDLESWSRRLSFHESYQNKDIVKVNKEMKK